MILLLRDGVAVDVPWHQGQVSSPNWGIHVCPPSDRSHNHSFSGATIQSGRVSSDTYLAPQFDPTKTPRIEDYLQPRQAGYDVFVNGHAPGSPIIGHKDLVSGTKSPESIKPEYGPYWGYSDDMPTGEDYVSIEFPRVSPGARKSFSELLIETDTLEKGPLALAAMAAAAERATRLKLSKEGSTTFPGFQVKEVVNAEDNRKATIVDDSSEAVESPAVNQETASISSLSKEHLEASKAVAVFKENRRVQSQQQPALANPSYISSLFRSPRKRPLPCRSRSFQRPLSPVPEVLSRDESQRKSDVSLPITCGDGISSSIMESFSCEVEKPSLLIPSENQQQDLDDYVLVEMIPESASSAHDENQEPATRSIDGRILDEDLNSKDAIQDDATSKVVTSTSQSPRVMDSEEDDSLLLRTPVRDPMFTPEVFISPKTTSAEYNFLRVNDMDPVERPIFGSLADHWEAAWATKRPVWDGRGILNDTNKYREDQKVMWHAVPFEERLAQALATQEDTGLERRNSFKTPTSRLSASRSSRSLQAH